MNLSTVVSTLRNIIFIFDNCTLAYNDYINMFFFSFFSRGYELVVMCTDDDLVSRRPILYQRSVNVIGTWLSLSSYYSMFTRRY